MDDTDNWFYNRANLLQMLQLDSEMTQNFEQNNFDLARDFCLCYLKTGMICDSKKSN